MPIPPSRMGQREFFVLYREAEWASVAEDIAQVTNTAMRLETLPALRSAMPALPEDAISFASDSDSAKVQ